MHHVVSIEQKTKSESHSYGLMNICYSLVYKREKMGRFSRKVGRGVHLGELMDGVHGTKEICPHIRSPEVGISYVTE